MGIDSLKGKMISFEGGEGCGKSTQIKLLKGYLEKQGITVEILREPGGSDIAEKIRNVILDRQNTKMTGLCETFLYAAARAQLMEEKVLELLKEDVVILFDRYVDSSYCYQGIVRGEGLENVMSLNELAIKGAYPCLTFLLNVTPEIGLERVFTHDREVNRLDLESIKFHKLVQQGYLALSELFKDRYIIIDADKSVGQVHEDIIENLELRV